MSNWFKRFGDTAKVDADIFIVIPYVLYLLRQKFYEHGRSPDHVGYTYGVAFTPFISFHFHWGKKRKE